MPQKDKKLSLWNIIGKFFLLVVSCFILYVGYISFSYHLPFMKVAGSTARYLALSAISAGVKIYDPTAASTRHTRLGPEEMVDYSSYPRLEQYVEHGKQPGIELLKMHNEKIVFSRYDFSYQPDVPRLREIRREMHLDAVVAGADSELGKLIRLRQWVRKQFSRLDYQKRMQRFDALTIWRNPQRNPEKKKNNSANYNPCHFFPLFYSQVVLSMGYTPRIVGINHSGYNAHGFVEIWSNEYRKWISMDPDLNLYYSYKGIPQNTLEVHNARYEHNSGMKLLQVMVEPGVQPEESIQNMLNYHRYIKIGSLRNDWLTNVYFRGHPKRSDLSTLFWRDTREKKAWRVVPVTSTKDDMYWTLNQAEIHVQPKKSRNGLLALVFRTVTPNFSHFIVEINGKKVTVRSSFFPWRLQKGKNSLKVFPVNSFGVEGIPSHVVVRYDG